VRSGPATALWAERVRAVQDLPTEATPPTWAKSLPETRDEARSRRPRAERPTTLHVRQMGRTRSFPPDVPEEVLAERPRRRADCAGGERPCPWVSCRFHLYIDVNQKNGSVKLNFPDVEVWELPASCVLDVAETGGEPGSGVGEGRTLEEVGALMNMTRERVRQIEVRAIAKTKRQDRRADGALTEHALDEGFGRPVRRLPVLADEDCDEGDDDADA
jgi:hypothetical protein